MNEDFKYNCPYWTREDHSQLTFPIVDVPLRDGSKSLKGVHILSSGSVTNIPDYIVKQIKNGEIELLPHKNWHTLPDGTMHLRVDRFEVVSADR